MNIQDFSNILLKNGYEYRYYEMIYDLLSSESSDISNEDRKNLFSIIQSQQFLSYSEHWHLRDGNYYDSKEFIGHLSSFNDFHNANHILHNDIEYQDFLNKNLTPVITQEVNNFFSKGSIIYKSYDDYTEQQRDIHIYFLSPIGLYNVFHSNQLFSDLLDSNIKPLLLNLENQHSYTTNPIINQGLSILEKSFENPEFFPEFVSFWTTYKKLLLPSNSVESDIEIIAKVHPEMHEQYCEYIGTPGINYEFEKSILSKKITQFYFEHFEEFISCAGKIPNPLVWIYESRKFFTTQNFIDNIEEKHFEYFKDFNHSSFFEKFITDVLFSQRFSSDISYQKVKSILSKNFNFENLFKHFEVDSPDSKDLSNFENYLLNLNKKLDTNDLLAFYRSSKLEERLVIKNTNQKRLKI